MLGSATSDVARSTHAPALMTRDANEMHESLHGFPLELCLQPRSLPPPSVSTSVADRRQVWRCGARGRRCANRRGVESLSHSGAGDEGGISEDRFLVAGHIVGWAEDRSQRLNLANGICLCVFHDRAFEVGYITLDEQLRLLVSPKVPPSSPLGRQLRPIANEGLRMPSKAPPGEPFLVAHRRRLLR
jgi:hypothetical protein